MDNLQSRAELESCSFVKTVLMLLVVVYHCFLFWSGGWLTEEPVYEAKVLAIIAMWITRFTSMGSRLFQVIYFIT